MKAVQIVNPSEMKVVELEKPTVGAGEVLVRIKYVGFCGSDLNTFLGRNPMVKLPVIPGHEVGAVIEEVGPNVPAGFEKGMNVTLNPYTNCGKCASCRNGRVNACEHNETLGVQRNGVMCEYAVLPWTKIIPAGNISPRDCALIEPMSVGFHAVSRAQVIDNEYVMVIGCGMIGIGAIVRAALRGATVIAVDLDDEKLELAKRVGASHVINSKTENVHERMQQITEGFGADVVIEAVGSPVTYVMAVDEVGFTGRVVCIGYAKSEVAFQRAAAQNWRMPQDASGWQQWQSELQQAFRLYTLALAGAPEYGAMNRMKEQAGLSIQAKWRLAATYALTGKMKPAEELVYNAETTVSPYSSMNQIYGSSDRDEAMILETLILMNRERDALQQAKVVSKNLSQEEWFSTQSTAFALMAMGRLAEKLSGTLDFVWTWNDKQQPAVKSAKAVFEKEIATTPKSGMIAVKNQGKGALSVDLITRTQLLNDTLPAISDNLRMDIRYANLNGTPISVNDIIQGTDFMAITSISNISGTSDYTNLALTHIIPSGWEIYNERMVAPETESGAADGSGKSVSKYNYLDIRDDRVLTYFNLRRGETKVFTVRLQATYAGNFILPAVQCEAMYDVNVQARSKAGRTTVSR